MAVRWWRVAQRLPGWQSLPLRRQGSSRAPPH